MIETDDTFEPLADGYSYLVDFLDLSFPTKRPDREHSYIEVRILQLYDCCLCRSGFMKGDRNTFGVQRPCTCFCVRPPPTDEEQDRGDETRGAAWSSLGRPVHRLPEPDKPRSRHLPPQVHAISISLSFF